MKERRTIRDFKPEKISKELLEEIENYAIYSPAHSSDFKAMIIDNEKVIDLIDRIIFKFSSRIHRFLYKPKFFYTIVKLFTPDRVHEYLKAKPKLEAALNRGRNFKHYNMIIKKNKTDFYIIGSAEIISVRTKFGQRFACSGKTSFNKGRDYRRCD